MNYEFDGWHATAAMAGAVQSHVTNPIQRLWAGWAPTMGILEHVGRKSAKRYRTPLTVFSTDDGVAILLTYGPDRDWLKNITAAGGGRMKRYGKTFELRDPQLMPKAQAARRSMGCGSRSSRVCRSSRRCCSPASSVDVSADGPLGDRGERHLAGEVLVYRADLHGPDNGGQRERGFQPREVFADARPSAAQERKKLPAVASLDVLAD